jgi:hypothetical protein
MSVLKKGVPLFHGLRCDLLHIPFRELPIRLFTRNGAGPTVRLAEAPRSS